MAADNTSIVQFTRQQLATPRPIEACSPQIQPLILVTTPVILLFSLFNFNHGHEFLANIELSIGLILIPLSFLLRRGKIQIFGSYAFFACMLILFFAVLVDGGVDASGSYWLPIFPVIAILIAGIRNGAILTAAFFSLVPASIAIWQFGLMDMPYTPYQFMTFIVCFFTFSTITFCLTAIHEFKDCRLATLHQQLAVSDQELRKAHADLEIQIAERTAKLAEAKRHLEQEVKHKELAIHQLRNTQEKFFQAQKMEAIGTLVGGIAHDFNNMLSGITANLYLVKNRTKDAQTIERLEKVDVLIMHAADMIRQMLTFARQDQIHLKEFNLGVFLEEAFKLARVSISEEIKVTLSTSRQAIFIRGDNTQLQQVLMNLMNNARDALAAVEQPEIHVALRHFQPDDAFRKQFPQQKSRSYACLSVRDNGEGIPAEKLQHIFEPFFTTKSVGHGTGLGLAMIYGAVESHGGVIDVKSRLGHGTTFSIYLPIITQSQTGLIEGQTNNVIPGHGETLLLVDDDEYLRQANADVLQSLNYKTIEAANGKEAIRIFQQRAAEIDLILMDVVMPDMGGVDAARRIRSIDKNIGVIFMTGYDKDKTLNGEITGEWENFIMKPLTIEKLSATIQRYFSKKFADTHA